MHAVNKKDVAQNNIRVHMYVLILHLVLKVII